MALKAGRVGVAPDQVDEFGVVKSDATSGYTKQEADAKFETKTDAAAALAEKQPITLSVPIEMLSGSKLTVEQALNGLNEVLDVSNDVSFSADYCNVNACSADVKIQGHEVSANLTISIKAAVPQYTQILNGLPSIGSRALNTLLYGPDKSLTRAYLTASSLSPHAGGIETLGVYNASFSYLI